MKYSIQKQHYLKINEVEISQNQFEELKQARSILLLAQTIEEIYEIVISNYVELEKDLLSKSIEFIVRQHFMYSDSFEDRALVNRRLINILTSTKLYTDHISKREFNSFNPEKITIKEILSKEYDDNKYYRFMEIIRNHVQHEGLAVHLTQYNSKRIGEVGSSQLQYTFDFSSKRSRLIENKRLKRRVLDEFEEEIDLKFALRKYIEGISRIHMAIREIISDSVGQSRSIIENAQHLYKQHYSDFTEYIHACITNTENGQIIESIPLLLNWDDVRLKLLERNKILSNLSRMYASGAVNS